MKYLITLNSGVELPLESKIDLIAYHVEACKRGAFSYAVHDKNEEIFMLVNPAQVAAIRKVAEGVVGKLSAGQRVYHRGHEKYRGTLIKRKEGVWTVHLDNLSEALYIWPECDCVPIEDKQ